MKTRRILYAALSFLAVNIGVCPYVVAATTLQLTQTSQEISGTDSESGVAFRASLLASDHVIVDLYIGKKRIHEEIDYTRNKVRLRIVSQANETPTTLSVQDILAFQQLRVSLTSKINKAARHGDALTRLINLMASAPAGHVFDITSGPSGGSFTSICPQIGKIREATYTPRFGTTHHKTVTVGPNCYVNPALGRCGIGGGHSPFVGDSQPFTQECLNHDYCCEETGESPPVCGFDCAPAFDEAVPGYLAAPDCGTTAGDWSDSHAHDIAVLSGGDSTGDPTPFTGVINEYSPSCPRGWAVVGTRTGTEISFTATNPDGASRFCAATSYSVTGSYYPPPGIDPLPSINTCNKALGTWSDNAGGFGKWSWVRIDNVLAPSVLSSRANAGPRPTDK